jgi:hypothetical protein
MIKSVAAHVVKVSYELDRTADRGQEVRAIMYVRWLFVSPKEQNECGEDVWKAKILVTAN